MADIKPVLVVPKTQNLSRALDDQLPSLREPRASRNGIVVIAPRFTQPGALVVACQLWPFLLRSIAIKRVAIVLSVQTFMMAEPTLAACVRCFRAHRLALACFHEGYLASDAICAWFENRRARRLLTSDAMVKLSEWYREHGELRGAFHAREIAERLAGLDDQGTTGSRRATLESGSHTAR